MSLAPPRVPGSTGASAEGAHSSSCPGDRDAETGAKGEGWLGNHSHCSCLAPYVSQLLAGQSQSHCLFPPTVLPVPSTGAILRHSLCSLYFVIFTLILDLPSSSFSWAAILGVNVCVLGSHKCKRRGVTVVGSGGVCVCVCMLSLMCLHVLYVPVSNVCAHVCMCY
jgi:hypothetical protein